MQKNILQTEFFKNVHPSWVLVGHTYNPKYSGDRDQEDCGPRLTQANSSSDPVSKIPNTQKNGW
jgi:hypothetical protein